METGVSLRWLGGGGCFTVFERTIEGTNEYSVEFMQEFLFIRH
jgi:hypothetical protein